MAPWLTVARWTSWWLMWWSSARGYLNGAIDFKGLIVVRGTTNLTSDTDVTGNANIWGSLWTTDINMVVGASAFIQYSTQALALANQLNGGRAPPSKLVVNWIVGR